MVGLRLAFLAALLAAGPAHAAIQVCTLSLNNTTGGVRANLTLKVTGAGTSAVSYKELVTNPSGCQATSTNPKIAQIGKEEFAFGWGAASCVADGNTLSFKVELKSASPPACNAVGTGSVVWGVNTVQDYATRCYNRLGITDHDDLKGPFDCDDLTDGAKELKVHIDGVDVSKGAPGNTGDFPANCDYPAWLFLAGQAGERCYGQTWVQKITAASNDKVEGALLCRHKKEWNNNPAQFDDVAMVLSNRKNGETCWFQTDDSRGTGQTPQYYRDGNNVLGPATSNAHSFWMKPTRTMGVGCISCHDNGPFMHSRWMNNVAGVHTVDEVVPGDARSRPYLNGTPPFHRWQAPTFRTVGRTGLKGPNVRKQCTQCHKLAAAGQQPENLAERDFQNCTKWIDFAVGAKNPEKNDTTTGRSFGVSYWMPKGHNFSTSTAWDLGFKKHVDLQRNCCSAKPDKLPPNCRVHQANPREIALVASQIEINGSINGGTSFVYTATEPWDPNPTPISVLPSDDLALNWGSPIDLDNCGVEATFPGGVSVGNIASGSNFSLDDGDPYLSIGQLTEPGIYRFDLFCDATDEAGASIAFEVPGDPDPYLMLNVIGDDVDQHFVATAGGPDVASTSITPNAGEPAMIGWTSEFVQDSTCSVTEFDDQGQPTGTSFSGAFGFVDLTLSPETTVSYELACTGDDDLEYVVELTLMVSGATGSIPTLTQWGVIIMMLMLATGGVVVWGRQAPLVPAGAHTDVDPWPAFDSTLYVKAVAVTIGLALLILAVAAVLQYPAAWQDLLGTTICVPIVAYLLHLWMLEREG